MSIETFHQMLSWAAIIFAICASLATAGTLITGNMIASKKDAEIERLQPRSLSESQKKTLALYLEKRRGKVGFASRLMDGEGADYANQLSQVFSESKWTVVPLIRTSLNDYPGYVNIFTTGPNLNDLAEYVCRSLNNANVLCRAESIEQNSLGGRLQPDTIYIVIGRKS